MQRLVIPLNILFSILLLLLAARIAADIAGYQLGRLGGGRATTSVTPQATLQPANQASLQSFAPILEKGLFGPATRGSLTPLTPQTAVQSAPTTNQSDLLLLGTVSGPASVSFALIRKTSSKEERVFKVGEQVFDLGRLILVRKESAELRAGTQTITLRTPDAPPEQAVPQPAAAAQPAQGVAAGVVPPSPGGTGIIDQRALNAALDNIGQAMTDARLLPSIKDGKVEGFRLSEVKPQGVFGSLGLKNGDILAKINDFPIDSPEKAIQSFMTLKGQNRIKLDIMRDSAPTTLSYDIR